MLTPDQLAALREVFARQRERPGAVLGMQLLDNIDA